MIKFCSLFSGSSGNSIFVGCGKTKILIDAGLSGIKIIKALESVDENPGDLSAILVSHEHIDHARGAGILSRKFNIPIYANEETWSSMESMLGPVKPENIKYFNIDIEIGIDDFCICPFSIPHDAANPAGFNMYAENRKITIATDIGHMNKKLLDRMEKSDILLIESNHDVEMLRIGPYPWSLKQRILSQTGHLSNDMAGKVVAYLAEKGTRFFMLGHLSRENNFPELAYKTVCNELESKKIKAGKDISLEVALRDCTSSALKLA